MWTVRVCVLFCCLCTYVWFVLLVFLASGLNNVLSYLILHGTLHCLFILGHSIKLFLFPHTLPYVVVPHIVGQLNS